MISSSPGKALYGQDTAACRAARAVKRSQGTAEQQGLAELRSKTSGQYATRPSFTGFVALRRCVRIRLCAPRAGGQGCSPGYSPQRIIVNQHALTLRVSPATAEHPPNCSCMPPATAAGAARTATCSAARVVGICGRWLQRAGILEHLPGDDGTTTPARLARDFAAIIEQGREALTRAPRRSCSSVSRRGADLAVVAAGQADASAATRRCRRMGLTREEEYVHGRHDPVVVRSSCMRTCRASASADCR